MISVMFQIDPEYEGSKVFVFTDGAIHKGFSCGTAMYGIPIEVNNKYGLKNIHIVSEVNEASTNNEAELTGIFNGIYHAHKDFPDAYLYIISDSEYCINSLTKWIYAWYKTYTYKRVSNTVIPSMITKGGTPLKNAKLICLIIHYIVEHNINLCFLNTNGHKNWKKEEDLLDQIAYWGKANEQTITQAESIFISQCNDIVDRVASSITKSPEGHDYRNFVKKEDGNLHYYLTIKNKEYDVIYNPDKDIKYSNYYILTSEIMRQYRILTDSIPF